MTLLTIAQDAAATAPNESYFLWGCILFAIAVVLLFLELLVPSGGMIAFLCGVAAIGSIVAFFMYDTTWGVAVTLGYIFLTPIALVFIFKLWINSPLARRMILGGPADQSATEASEEAAIASEEARQQRLAELKQLIGVEGVTETALRPIGTVRINNQRIDGMAESGVIESNTPVIVTDVYDNQIKVRPR